MKQPTVYVVDDDEAVRAALSIILEQEGLNVQQFDSGESFLEKISANDPGCLLTDLRLPGISGIELQQTLTERGIKLPVIILTGWGDVHESVQAMKAGAVDFLEKTVRPPELLHRVKEALERDASQRTRDEQYSTLRKRFMALSTREKEVVSLVVEGKTNKEIAQVLDISYRTVEKYRAGAMSKLGVDNVVELAKIVPLLTTEV